MTKVIEAVRQLRGEAHPEVQVTNCDLALAQRHRRRARHAPRQRHPDHGAGVRRWRTREKSPRRGQRRDASLLGCGAGGPLPDQALHRLRRGALVSARDLPVLHAAARPTGATPRAAGAIYTFSVMRRAPGALRHRLCDARRGADDDDQHRRLRLRHDCISASRSASCSRTPKTGRRCRCSRRLSYTSSFEGQSAMERCRSLYRFSALNMIACNGLHSESWPNAPCSAERARQATVQRVAVLTGCMTLFTTYSPIL